MFLSTALRIVCCGDEQIPMTSIIKAGCSTAACTLQMCAALRGASVKITHTSTIPVCAHGLLCNFSTVTSPHAVGDQLHRAVGTFLRPACLRHAQACSYDVYYQGWLQHGSLYTANVCCSAWCLCGEKSHTRLLSQYAHMACCVTSALLHRPSR
jgi:hypothetical protein